MHFTAVAARGTEDVLARELATLRAREVAPGRGIVAFEGTLETAYRACLYLRTASRVLMPLARFATGNPDTLYEGVRSVDWRKHLSPDGTLAIECVAAAGLDVHTHYHALKTKDAVCDQLRERSGRRPNVDRERPDVRLHVHVGVEDTSVSLDLAGESMHRRGYRPRGAEAPVRETLAAALLYLARWDERAAQGEPLVDPMCGAGTFVVEAALMAGDVAPGLLREYHGMLGWRGHDAALWQRLWTEAETRARVGAAGIPPIFGFDTAESAVRATREAARRAGVARTLRVEHMPLAQVTAPVEQSGIVVANPPYGERLGHDRDLAPLYAELGDALRQRFPGWTGYVLTGSPSLAKAVGLRAKKKHAVWNGPIECRFIEFPIDATRVLAGGPGWRRSNPAPRPRGGGSTSRGDR